MDRRGSLSGLAEIEHSNAVLAWLLIGFVGVVIVGSLLSGDFLWAGFATVFAVLSMAPTIATRNPRLTLPWEVLELGALPLIGRAIAAASFAGEFATYLSVAAIALIIAVELDAFTSVRMSSGFAVLFVIVATMATAGVWAVVRWSLDAWLETAFLLDPALTEDEIETGLMWEFGYSTAAGVFAGVTFEWYFRRERSCPSSGTSSGVRDHE